MRRYRARKRKGREERLSIVRVRKWDCKEKKKKTLGIAFDRFARSRDLLLCRKWSDISSPWRDIETKYIKKKKKNVKIKEKIRGIFASRQLATSFCSRLNASTCAYPPSLQSPPPPPVSHVTIFVVKDRRKSKRNGETGRSRFSDYNVSTIKIALDLVIIIGIPR